MNSKRIALMMVLIIVLLTVTNCAPEDGKNTPDNPAGFFWGIWHG